MSQQYGTDGTLAQPWRFFSGSGGVLVLLCFFLPFITVSCGAVDVLDGASAYELAQGPTLATGEAGDPSPILWLIFIGGALGLLSAATPRPMQQIGGAGSLISLLFVIIPLILYYFNTRSEIREAELQGLVINVSWQIGFWGLLLGVALLGVGGILALFNRQENFHVAPSPHPPGFARVPTQLPAQPRAPLGGVQPPNLPPRPDLPPRQNQRGGNNIRNTEKSRLAYDHRPTQLDRGSSIATSVSNSTVNKHRVPPTEATVFDKQSRTPNAWLVPLNKNSKQQYSLTTKTIIGRDPRRAQVVLNDSRSSSEHACIRYQNGEFVLYDLASTNGTYCNRRRIDSPTPLTDGDLLIFGRSEFTFKEVRA